jgi:hypothetical protein
VNFDLPKFSGNVFEGLDSIKSILITESSKSKVHLHVANVSKGSLKVHVG